jgi:hypothetical protein
LYGKKVHPVTTSYSSTTVKTTKTARATKTTKKGQITIMIRKMIPNQGMLSTLN